MKILITGGMGFIGSALTDRLMSDQHSVTILERNKKKRPLVPNGVSSIEGDSTQRGIWQRRVAEHDVVINLAGTSIFQRWNSEVKKAIYDSRLLTTKNVVEALAARGGKETHLISTSGIGYYGYCGDEILDENNPPGSDFLAQLAADWEAEALKAAHYGARVVLCRFGIVLGRSGGVLRQLVPVFQRYLGSPLGNGKQWFSWIHEKDLANIILFLLDRKEIEGPVNCTAPHPVRNREFTKIFSQVLDKPILVPFVPGVLLKLLFGEFANVVLKGQRVVPRKLLDSGFRFEFPTIKQALQDLLES